MRTSGTRGQAAIEFLSTYGFAFFVLLITVGALSYFGVFNLSSLRNNECYFPEGTECVEFILNRADPALTAPYFPPGSPGPANDGYLRLRLANTFGANLTFVNLTAQATELGTTVLQCYSSQSPLSGPTVAAWPAGWNATIWCHIPPVSYHPTQRYNAIVTLNFTQQGGSYQHVVKGTVSAIAQ